MWGTIKARLVDDWHQAGKWWSVRMNLIGAVLLPLLISVQVMPPEIREMFPVEYRALVAGLFQIAVVIARVYAQKKLNA